MTEKNPSLVVNPVALVTGTKGKPAKALASGAEIARSLQIATAKINPLIARAEKALAALQLNVPASIPLGDPEDDEDLAFRKVDRDWGLFLDSGFDSDDSDNWNSVRLHTASREKRLAALAKLDELEYAIVSEAQRQRDIAVNTVAIVEDYLTALEARKA